MKTKAWTCRSSLLPVFVLLAIACVWGVAAEAQAQDCSHSTVAELGTPSILCPSLPDTPPIALPANKKDQGLLYADWAWKSFIALNWPAVEPKSPDYKRGFPDEKKNFTGDGAQPVWGTWKEKRELFRVGAANQQTSPGPWNGEVNYHKDYPPCSGHAALLAEMSNPRRIAQAGKAFEDSLDEVEQVPSEARHPAAVAHKPVKPRVWRRHRPKPGVVDTTALLYEVKFNYDYYNYVASDPPKGLGLYNDAVKLKRAALSGNNSPGIGGFDNQPVKAINFPSRPKSKSPSNPQGYSAADCISVNSKLDSHPCTTGAIQTKAAWVLSDPQRPDNVAPFHTTEAQYYRKVPKSKDYPDGICTAYGKFDLLGLHIIQKTILQGHYIYATFEHSSTDIPDEFVYANVYQGQTFPAAGDSPNALTVTRMHDRDPAAVAMNEAYQKLIKAQSASSVWQNYALTGVQFLPVNCSPAPGELCGDADDFSIGRDDPTAIGQPFYLANLVVETNWGLQNFQGNPPGGDRKNGQYDPTGVFNPDGSIKQPGFRTGFGDKPTDHFVANPSTTTFARGAGNVGHSRKNRGAVFNMGGCMGCHGIAQGTGTDFSFALLFGGDGADVEPINEEAMPAPGPPPKPKP